MDEKKREIEYRPRWTLFNVIFHPRAVLTVTYWKGVEMALEKTGWDFWDIQEFHGELLDENRKLRIERNTHKPKDKGNIMPWDGIIWGKPA